MPSAESTFTRKALFEGQPPSTSGGSGVLTGTTHNTRKALWEGQTTIPETVAGITEAQQFQINQQRIEAELGKYQRSSIEQTRRAEFAEAVAENLFAQTRATPHNKYAAVVQGTTSSVNVGTPQVPSLPTAADIQEELVRQRMQGQRLQEELSNRMISVEQVVAEAAASVQRAKEAENVAWQAQMASEMRAGRSDAAAEAAAMGLVKGKSVKKK